MAIIRMLLLFSLPLFWEGFQVSVRTWMWGFTLIQRQEHH